MNEIEAAEERAWREGAGDALRASEDQIDAVTLMRLRAARARALAVARPRPRLLRWGVPAAALAAGLAAWVLAPRQALLPGPEPVNVAAAEALDLLADEMEPEFYQNLDLYLWLEDSGDRA